MKYYEAQALIAIASGAVLHLTDAQASARKTVLKPVADKPGVFEATAGVQFKKGEVFGCANAVDKNRTLELKTDARDFDARIRKERAAAAEAKEKALAERKRRADAIAAAEKRKAEERRRAAETKTRSTEARA